MKIWTEAALIVRNWVRRKMAREKEKVRGRWWVWIHLCGRHLQSLRILHSRFLVIVFQYLLSPIVWDFVLFIGSIVARNCFGQVVCPLVSFQTCVPFHLVECYRSGVSWFNCFQPGGNGEKMCYMLIRNGEVCCFEVYIDRVGGSFLSLAFDSAYGHPYSAEFCLEYCTCYVESLSVNVYFPGVFYCNNTCPSVIFRFLTICIDFHVCVSFCSWGVNTYVVVFWVDPCGFGGDFYIL
jgi:hypothetical protein